MTASDIFLLALGPAIALSAGLIIYGFGASAPGYRKALRESAEKLVETKSRP